MSISSPKYSAILLPKKMSFPDAFEINSKNGTVYVISKADDTLQELFYKSESQITLGKSLNLNKKHNITTNPNNGDIILCNRTIEKASDNVSIEYYDCDTLQLKRAFDLVMPDINPDAQFYFEVTNIHYSKIDNKLHLYWNIIENTPDVPFGDFSGVIVVNPTTTEIERFVPFRDEGTSENHVFDTLVEAPELGCEILLEFNGGHVCTLSPSSNYKYKSYDLKGSNHQAVGATVDQNKKMLYLVERDYVPSSQGFLVTYYINYLDIVNGEISDKYEDLFEIPEDNLSEFMDIHLLANKNNLLLPTERGIFNYNIDKKTLVNTPYPVIYKPTLGISTIFDDSKQTIFFGAEHPEIKDMKYIVALDYREYY